MFELFCAVWLVENIEIFVIIEFVNRVGSVLLKGCLPIDRMGLFDGCWRML